MRWMVPFLFVSLALAGCTDDVPTGTFASSGHALSIDGTVDLAFQERVRPAGDGIPAQGGDSLCPPEGSPPSQFDCVDPSSSVQAHFMELADIGTKSYTLVWTNATAEMPIGPLVDEEGMYTLNMTFDEDHSGFDAVELRVDDLTVATAVNGEGNQVFTLNEALTQTSVSADWEGSTLNVDVMGLPANATFDGWLVSDDENGEAVHDVSFAIVEGANTFEADQDIGTWTSFHIHVAGTKLNLATADI